MGDVEANSHRDVMVQIHMRVAALRMNQAVFIPSRTGGRPRQVLCPAR